MNTFSDFASLYDYLEQIDIQEGEFQIAAMFMQLRDHFVEQGELESAQNAQVEIDVFNFQINQGKVTPLFKGSDHEGNQIEYPSFDRFTDADAEYLLSRLQSTKNPLLTARYGHLLWKWKRDSVSAKRASEAYLELSKKYDELSRDFPEKTWNISFLHALENFFALSLELNYETERAKSEILETVRSYPIDSSSSFLIHLKLVELMLSNRIFMKADFNDVQEKLWQVASKAQSVHQFVQLCVIGEKVGNKFESQLKNWQEEIGKKYEEITLAQKGTDNLDALMYCGDAIKAYKKAKNDQKVAELTLVYDKLKRNIELTPHTQELDSTDYVKWCEEKATEFSKNDIKYIVKTLMRDTSLLPDVGKMREQAKSIKESSLVFHLSTPVALDSNGNKVQIFSTEEEKQKFYVLQEYGIEIGLKRILLDALFSKSIEAGLLHFQSLYDFLKQDSWVGQPIPKGKKSGEVVEHIWLELVSPALKNFFEEAQKPEDSAQFILFIDSLVPKLEGMIRDICFLIEIPIFKFERDREGRETTRERYIHELLYEEKLKSIFGENDLFFFKFLFIEKGGYNLRNKVAHGLMYEKEYSKTLCFLVLLSFLRLSKFQFSDSPIQYDDNAFTETDKDSKD